ncbi:hypothetical protein HMPREF1870_01887 [Bacteroidales bacterium KA00344]|nr:hypothetical protein HMPREF1870_01887 [Bacteroidales bacterium KA00344]
MVDSHSCVLAQKWLCWRRKILVSGVQKCDRITVEALSCCG